MQSSRNNNSLENNKNIYYNMDNNISKKRIKLTNVQRREKFLSIELVKLLRMYLQKTSL